LSLERIIKKSQGKNVPPKIKKKPVGEKSAEGLSRAIDRYFVGQNEKHIKKINGFHPSYTRTCARWWYLLFKGVPSEARIDSRLHRIFDNGHKVHERWYEYFEAMSILIDSEIPIKISDPIPIVGTADGIIDWGGYKLIEMKSISAEGFEFRRYYNKPKDDHYVQAQIYLRALKLEEGFVIYENKNTQNFLILPISRDDEAYEKKIRQWKKIYDKILKDELPKRPYKQNSKNCQECDLFDHCWNDLRD